MKIHICLKSLFVLLVIIQIKNIDSVKLDDLYFEVDSNYMNETITNIILLTEAYIYLDITQNPPNSFHSKINLKDELKKINIEKPKPYYEFYREIKRVFAKLKDYHTMIFPTKNSGELYCACIPFSFNIQLDENNKYQLYIKKDSKCPFNYTDPELNQFIDDSIKDKTFILSINGKDPFDYIQNFGKEYFNLKSEHAQFTAVMNYISWLPLYFFPLNESEFNLTIKLSNNEEKIFPYFYFLNDTIYDIPISQDIFLYEWNYSTIGFRCRVDEENKLNVFYQNAFIFFELEENEMLDLVYKCSKLFHSNNYKIVGIESRNQGGLITLPTYLEQLIQPKICKNRVLASLRNNEYLESAFELYHNEFLDIKTCKPFKSFQNFLEEKPDDYGNSIKHYRTKISDIISIENKTDLNKKREELIKTKNTKKPTDIIIFTDYYSISATSIFLKIDNFN